MSNDKNMLGKHAATNASDEKPVRFTYVRHKRLSDKNLTEEEIAELIDQMAVQMVEAIFGKKKKSGFEEGLKHCESNGYWKQGGDQTV